jgi:lambda repressor-like predicted transcriptional regulator
MHCGVAAGLPPSEDARLESLFGLQKAFQGVVNPDGSLKPEGIKALFERFRLEIKAFAESQGVSDAYVHAIIARRKRDTRIENAIAERLGFEPNRMWGRQAPDQPERKCQ